MTHSFLKWKSPSPISLTEFSTLFTSFMSQSPVALAKDARVGVAYSGGPDSLALTVLLSQLLGSERVLALTVDHGLPGELATEPMAHIERLIEPFGIPHQTIRLSWPKGHPLIESTDGTSLSGKFQQLAREQRYESLFRACEAEKIPLLLTGHQLDDDLVTFFYRWSRMSGAEGLAGMRPFTWLPSLSPKASLTAPNGTKGSRGMATVLGRPFLDVPRSRLLDTCKALGLVPHHDACNLQLGQLRNSVREALVAVQAKEGEDKVSTDSLRAMMKRLKMIRQESHAQTQNIIASHVVFDFQASPSPGSTSHHNKPSSPVTGDAILVLPAGSHSEMMAARYWTTNKYIMTRILCALCQYVANTPTFKGRIETVFDYARGLSASFHMRVKKSYRMQKRYSELPDLHSSLLAAPAAAPLPPLTGSAPSPDSRASSMNNNFGSGGESDPLRRLAFIKPFNINHTTIYPLGSRDTLIRLNSSHALGSTLQSVGPALLFTRASMKRSILRNYYQDMRDVQPGDAFLWDRRMLLQYHHPARATQEEEGLTNVVDLGDIEEFKTSNPLHEHEQEPDHEHDQKQEEQLEKNASMLDSLENEREAKKSLTSLVASTSSSSTIMSQKMKKKFLQSAPLPFILPATEALFLSQSRKKGLRASPPSLPRGPLASSSLAQSRKSPEPTKHDFRIVMLSLDALKYMAKLCLSLGRTDTLAELERIRAGLPSDLLYAYPMIISHGSGDIWLPTFGISLCTTAKAPQGDRTHANQWTVSSPGKSHLMMD